MEKLHFDEMTKCEGGAAICTLLDRATFMSIRYSYWACNDGTYYATFSKFSASSQLWEPLANIPISESW